MDIIVLDTVVSNILRTKRDTNEMLKRMNRFFGKSFNNITEISVRNRIIKIESYREIVDCLKKLPNIEQRSQEWHDIRKKMITASDFAQALGKGKFGTAKDFYKSKCGYEQRVFDSNCPPLKWGIRYEEVANMFYQQKMGVRMTEFGIIQHPSISFIGASPDGVSDLGIMLEIKCPYKRKKTETIPEQYYYQIQGQLEVCNLEECDYLECYIIEYSDRSSMISDDTICYKGVVYETESGVFEHGLLNDTEHEIKKFCKVYYYGIKDYFLRRVLRDKEFFNEALTQLVDVWKNVETYRLDKGKYDTATKSSIRKKIAKEPKVPCLFRDDIIDD
jgi:putative phage-type endonuclease